MNREEIIWCSRWKELCDYIYEPSTKELPSGVVGCDITNIKEFFNKIKDLPNKYIVISYRSDYGVTYQKLEPPAADLAKWIKFQLNPETFGYNDVVCPARLNRDRCSITDRYSVKCYAHTDSTFDSIPDNILHWFTTNCNIMHDRVTAIPFGVHDTEEVISNIESVSTENIERKNILYVNFQFYTLERYEIFQNFLYESNTQLRKSYTIDRDIPHQDYLRRLKSHHFVVSPPGNGIDCFRNLESIYMGAKPMVLDSAAVKMYILAGAVPYTNNNYESIVLSLLDANNNKFIFQDISHHKLVWSYWNNLVLDTRNTFHL